MPSGIKPWTIKGIPPEARNAAIAAAQCNDLAIGPWLRRAVLAQVHDEAQCTATPAVEASADIDEFDLLDRIAAIAPRQPSGRSRRKHRRRPANRPQGVLPWGAKPLTSARLGPTEIGRKHQQVGCP